MNNVHKLKNIPLELDLKNLIKKAPQLQGAETKLAELKHLLAPSLYWMQLPVTSHTSKQVVLGQGKFKLTSHYLSLGLAGSSEVTLLAATIGKKLPEYSNKCLQRGDLWEGTIADIFGSYAVEALVDKLQKHLQQMFLPKGLYPTLRFSPGYGDWPLTAQQEMIALLETEPEITVTESFFLQPVKSVTAALGWSPTQTQKGYPTIDKKTFCQRNTTCEYCQTQACRF
ncbi:MAG: hypothetical protein ACOX3A_03485 [bacterium]|jgi:hypothetical protein